MESEGFPLGAQVDSLSGLSLGISGERTFPEWGDEGWYAEAVPGLAFLRFFMCSKKIGKNRHSATARPAVGPDRRRGRRKAPTSHQDRPGLGRPRSYCIPRKGGTGAYLRRSMLAGGSAELTRQPRSPRNPRSWVGPTR